MGQGINDALFGTGESGGDRKYSPPIHGTTQSGKPVTFSTAANGETLIADGHKTAKQFYGTGHDHFDGKGDPHKNGDRGQYTG